MTTNTFLTFSSQIFYQARSNNLFYDQYQERRKIMQLETNKPTGYPTTDQSIAYFLIRQDCIHHRFNRRWIDENWKGGAYGQKPKNTN